MGCVHAADGPVYFSDNNVSQTLDTVAYFISSCINGTEQLKNNEQYCSNAVLLKSFIYSPKMYTQPFSSLFQSGIKTSKVPLVNNLVPTHKSNKKNKK